MSSNKLTMSQSGATGVCGNNPLVPDRLLLLEDYNFPENSQCDTVYVHMHVKRVSIISIVVIVLGLAYFFANVSAPVSQKDATYIIDGREVTLKNGYAETEVAPGSASKVITNYFGNEAAVDLDGDGVIDTVFLLTQSGAGTGVFYYVVAALSTPDGYVGSHGLLLGDRIAPQSTSVGITKNPKVVVVNYADRKFGESFAVAPSVGKSIQLLFDPKDMQFGEVVQNFEGESR